MHLIPQILICGNMCEELPTRVAHLHLDVQQCLMGVTQMTDLGYSNSSSLPSFKHKPNFNTMHIVRINYIAGGPKPQT